MAVGSCQSTIKTAMYFYVLEGANRCNNVYNTFIIVVWTLGPKMAGIHTI